MPKQIDYSDLDLAVLEENWDYFQIRYPMYVKPVEKLAKQGADPDEVVKHISQLLSIDGEVLRRPLIKRIELSITYLRQA